jgi:hypothetical protein
MKLTILSTVAIGGLMSFFSLLPTLNASASLTEARYHIKARHSGKCVHQHGGILRTGGAVTQWDCINQPNVQLTKGFNNDGSFVLRFKHSNQCLAPKNGQSANGTEVIQAPCSELASQRWREVSADGGYVKLRSGNGACLHQHGAEMGNGGRITMWDCVNQSNVMWKILPAR